MRMQKIFPALSTHAYYDQETFTIHIEKYTEAEFFQGKSDAIISLDIDKVSLVAHELTHFQDHISTLWGQALIVSFFNALNSRLNNKENDFWRIREYDRISKKQSFPSYYSTINNPIKGSAADPWKYSYSHGSRFSSEGRIDQGKPILFSNFFNKSGVMICRQPISVAAILETNAINNEYLIKIGLSGQLGSVDKVLNINSLKSDLLGILYDPELTQYTVMAHLASNVLNISDAIEAYQIASKIGTLSLNLPDSIIKQINQGKVKKAINIKNIEGRVKHFIREDDKGFIFFAFMHAMRKQELTPEELLSYHGLPISEKLEPMIINIMEQNLKKIISGPLCDFPKIIIKNGIDIFKKKGMFGDKINFLDDLNIKGNWPNIVFKDFEASELSFHKTVNNTYGKCIDFLNACGY